MALSAPPGQELPPGKQFSYQLAAAVKCINWTYAIFWSTSTGVRPAGVLTWKDGFYNGQIKTRKVTNSAIPELTAKERVLHRSEQLRELYRSLLSGNSDHRVRRPATSLSPEDLTDDEWYYMISMTYTFQPGQGLPGKSLASNKPVWLCNAQHADTKTFQRALLAKTVVCFPFMGGVLELGASNPVLEDPDMVNRIKISFWQVHLQSFCVEESSSGPSAVNQTGDTNFMLEDLHHYAIDVVPSQPREVERIRKEMDEFHSFHESRDMGARKHNWIMNGSFVVPSSPYAILVMNAFIIDDVIVIVSSSIQNYHPASFIEWRRASDLKDVVVRVHGESQNFWKKVVDNAKLMNNGGGDNTRSQQRNITAHVMSKTSRGENNKKMFQVLKSFLPSIHKVDKASILVETISNLKELKERVEELESSRAPSCLTETIGLRRDDIASRKKIKVSGEPKGKVPELERPHDVPTPKQHHQCGCDGK